MTDKLRELGSISGGDWAAAPGWLERHENAVKTLEDILYCAYKFDDKPHQLFRAIEKAIQFAPESDRQEIVRLMELATKKRDADSANLARGMALEQAAQHIPILLWHDNPTALENGCECGWRGDGNRKWSDHIRSLDPDAAQALAAHDVQWRSAIFEAAIPLEVIAGQLNIGNMQEISVELARQIHKSVELIRAVLAESQPAPLANVPVENDYAQRTANETGKPYYVGPDNVKGGSHWVYPQPAPAKEDK